ncbi:Domain of uncharacterised function (DUF2825) [Salmonella enterica]|nr:Domain of uncharacterised function (DUF2825) [Salmonella enterica]
MMRPQPVCKTVYPRWRGEHPMIMNISGARCGLSPLARGTRAGRIMRNVNFRFIPAGAGNTEKDESVIRYSSVYPRWRGEHPLSLIRVRPEPGLSPLARGTPTSSVRHVVPHRFIPAGAGNTACQVLPMIRSTVYPRWRGEHLMSRLNNLGNGGLSPLARGTHQCVTRLVALRRFIPAGAGNTQIHSLILVLHKVYPRWRGEHAQRNNSTWRNSGLSPLARGTRNHEYL